jgi:hypothetical protein
LLRLKKLALPVALLVAASLSTLASTAFAGSKPPMTYDPTAHAIETTAVIHIYSFRWLTMGRTTGYVLNWAVIAKGTLSQDCTVPWRHNHQAICSTAVSYKLADPRPCLAVTNLRVWSHLYVRPYGTTRPWRELGHYHDVFAADCA